MNNTPATGPSTSIFRFAALDAARPGTLYFLSEAARDAYVAAHRYATAVEGSPASTADRFIYA